MKENMQAGFTYTVESFVGSEFDSDGRLVRLGEVAGKTVTPNLMPLEGLNRMLEILLRDGTKVATWYLMLYENDYLPQSTDTMALFPGLAGEITEYAGATRPPIVFDAPDGGQCSNITNRNLVTFLVPKTVRGGAVCSSPTKGSGSGVLISAARFSSPKPIDMEDPVLRVTVGFGFVSNP